MENEMKMPGKPGQKKKTFTKKPNLKEINVLVETKGLTKGTTDKRNNVRDAFNRFLETWNTKTLDDFCKAKPAEERKSFKIALSLYFNTYTVGPNDDELPMRNYVDCIRSHLRTVVKEKTVGEIDICDPHKMPYFHVSCFFLF